MDAKDPHWWRDAVVYQIYPRSFADSTGDGIGDLPGITSRVPYLASLGVDAVWLSPFYPSALADGGYDVDDYRDVHPQLGTLADFDALVSALHAVGIRVIVDIVPNHTSDRHVWFQEALASPAGSSARDRYIFRDGIGPDGTSPPADWVSTFGGPGWEPVGDGQWYYHRYATEQPDLNWKNASVRADFVETLRFWSDRGVDGFRVDVAHGLTKDIPVDGPLPSEAELASLPWDGLHPLWDRDEVHEIYAEWRAVFEEYDPPRMAVAEAWVSSDRRWRYARPESLGQAFNFDLLRADFDATQFRDLIAENLAIAARAGSSTTWVLSNHDVIRHATRYGFAADQGSLATGQSWLGRGAPADEVDSDLGLRRAVAATLLTLALPGSAYVYQGEELGLPEVTDIPDDSRQDPVFFRTGGVMPGRDGGRVPLPWTSTGSSFGFATGNAHLPQPPAFGELAVEVQAERSGSMLATYRAAIALRNGLRTDDSLEWLPTGRDDVLAFRRSNGWTCITNFGTEPYVHGFGTPRLSSETGVDEALPGATTAWL